ncbi:MAG: zinc ribbon domain-containing protein [Spirochaetia bacterium]
MNTSLEQLQSLQVIFSEKYEISRRLEDMPKQLTSKSEVVDRLKKSMEQKQSALNALQEKVRTLKLYLSDTQKKREDSENKMSLIKTQREFELLEKEIQDAVSEEDRARKELARDQKQVEELEVELNSDISLVQSQEAELMAIQKEMDSAISADRSRIKELEKKQQSISPDMSTDLIYKLETIVRNKNGLGIVAVRGGICRGCNILLPGQFVNEVRAAEDIKFCPSCSRVLYYETGGEDFSQVLFDDDDMGGLTDLIDEEDLEEEDPILIDPDLAGDYEDN